MVIRFYCEMCDQWFKKGGDCPACGYHLRRQLPTAQPEVDRVLAEEFGREAKVWIRSDIAIGNRQSDNAWTLVVYQLATKAAHFGRLALGHATR